MPSEVDKAIFTNDAFISYSRKDREFAAKLEKALEDYKPPKELNVPQHRFEVFREEADFTGTEYKEALEKHLKVSAKMIVICSPNARGSSYVNDEIRLFAEIRGAQHIIPVLLSGIPNNEAKPGQENDLAFPQALCELKEIPLGPDFRRFDPKKDKVHKGIYEGAWFTILANLYDLGRPEVEQREKKRQGRRMRNIIIASIVLFLTLASLTVYAWISRQEAIRQRDLAEKRQRVATSRFLAAQAGANLESWPQRSLLLAAEALSVPMKVDGIRLPTAEASIRQSLSRVGGWPVGMPNTNLVQSVAFSPDSKWLATAGGGHSEDNTVYLWEVLNPFKKPVSLNAHTAPVLVVKFSPDGRWLASGGKDGTVFLWNLTASNPGAEPTILQGHTSWILALSFSPDNRWLATASGNVFGVEMLEKPIDHTVRIWNVALLKEPPVVLRDHRDDITAVAFSPDSRMLATASRDGTTRLWNVTASNPAAQPAVLGEGNKVWTLAVAFSPNGRWLATGRAGNAHLWELTAGGPKSQPILLWHEGTVQAVAFSHNSHWLATGGNDGAVRLFDLSKQIPSAQPMILGYHDSTTNDLAFSPNDRWLLSGSSDNTSRLWNLEAKDKSTSQRILRGHESAVVAVAFSPDSQWVATGSHDGTARLWSTTMDFSGDPISLHGLEGSVHTFGFSPDGHWLVTSYGQSIVNFWELKSENSLTGPLVPRKHAGNIICMAFSPNKRWLATAGGIPDNTVRLWDLSDSSFETIVLRGEVVASMGGAMAFSSDSQRLVVAEGILEKNVWLWDLNNMGANPTLLYGPSKHVTTWTFSPNGEWFALGDKDGTVRRWNLTDPLTPPRVFEGEKSKVFSLAISPDGRWLAKGIKGVAQVWDLSKPSASPLVLPVEKYPVTTMVFSNDSRHLAAVGGFLQKMLWVWDIMDLTASPMVLRGHDDGIKAVSFSPDRRWLVTGSKDGCARIFDLRAPDPSVEPLVLRQYKSFLKGQWGVTAVAFSPDGRWLCTSSIGTAHLWRLKSEDLIALACNLAGRNLSCEEWQQFLADESYRAICPELPYPQECDEKRQTKSSMYQRLK